MTGLILGTAGHIDHGKSALVRALTGVDPDRLREEKERGITIELGFAELDLGDDVRFGVVDVPGHEAFVRAMVAGAAGVDVVVLIVAADEGVMPQTREHLAIVELLGVSELVVALTKCDLVDADWLDLVTSDVEELLAGTRYVGATQVRTAATTELGLDRLREVLKDTASRIQEHDADDLVRLPLDRVFTMQGTGTVVTGTLWSGTLTQGDQVRILPHDLTARVRGVQVHGREVPAANPGDRTAVALTGDGADRTRVERGATLVTSPHWVPSHMLTARVEMLDGSDWLLEHNQRIHLHHGTTEVLARCALLEEEPLAPGDTGWVQFRLEEPLAARARDRFVIRAYSPVTTIGGGVIAEVSPPKRRRLDEDERSWLGRVLDGTPPEALAALVELSGWSGTASASVPVHSGMTAAQVDETLSQLGPDAFLTSSETLFGSRVRAQAESIVLRAVDGGHATDPLRFSVPLAEVRAAFPPWAASHVADATADALVSSGQLAYAEGGLRRPDHRAELTADQAEATEQLTVALTEGGLAPPFLDELPAPLAERNDLRSLVRHLEQQGTIQQIADGFYVIRHELDAAVDRVQEQLAGRTELGPADFREALPVSRKWLIPLLNHLDGEGVTIRRGTGRDVPARS